jgi:hypothetical protein
MEFILILIYDYVIYSIKIFNMSETSSDDCVKIYQFGDYYDDVIKEMFTERPREIPNYLKLKDKFMEWLKSDGIVNYKPDAYSYSSMPPYPYWVVRNIVRNIIKNEKKICPEDVAMLKKKIIGYSEFDYMMMTMKNEMMGGKRHKRSGHKRSGHKRSGHKRSGHKRSGKSGHKSRRSTRRHRR